MATFPQWLERYPEWKSMYICGEDAHLREFVLTSELASRSNSPLDFVTVDVKKSSPAAIEEAMWSSANVGARLVVIRSAQDLPAKVHDTVHDWMTQCVGDSLILVSNEIKPHTKDSKFRPFVDRGRFVECKPLTFETMCLVAPYFVDIDKEAAMLLAMRAGSSARYLMYLRLFGYLDEQITLDTVCHYVEPISEDVFVEALMEGDKATALRAIETEVHWPLWRGSLEYALVNMLKLSGIPRDLDMRDVAVRTSIPLFLMPRYYEWMVGITTAKLHARLRLLVNADLYHTQPGYLEFLVAGWK